MDKWQLESRTQQLSTGPGAHGLFAILPCLILIPLTPLPHSILVSFIYTTLSIHKFTSWGFVICTARNTLNA